MNAIPASSQDLAALEAVRLLCQGGVRTRYLGSDALAALRQAAGQAECGTRTAAGCGVPRPRVRRRSRAGGR
jgi:hypothetical protein